jgi:hypothetical protein
VRENYKRVDVEMAHEGDITRGRGAPVSHMYCTGFLHEKDKLRSRNCYPPRGLRLKCLAYLRFLSLATAEQNINVGVE